MKLIIYLLFFIPFLGNTQELNSEAKYIKEKYTYEYENNFKKFALTEWKDDYSMVVYEINRQASSFTQILQSLKSENLEIFYNSIKEWSREGYKDFNIKKMTTEFKTIDFKNCIQLKVDWSMVKYEYDRQVKAKNSF